MSGLNDRGASRRLGTNRPKTSSATILSHLLRLSTRHSSNFARHEIITEVGRVRLRRLQRRRRQYCWGGGLYRCVARWGSDLGKIYYAIILSGAPTLGMKHWGWRVREETLLLSLLTFGSVITLSVLINLYWVSIAIQIDRLLQRLIYRSL